ncbi:ubiquitin-conjugating enzyme E2 Z-like [Pocillopora damicornis]|uniref:ubiquitin-conjugating enzyme E2 Z-like n=1 Tax=Pocillopora damicornis TaxID=46731 RepID=UPI000F54E07D|nr:ubiquitin-conjugating enzyme E2 Z-like [Pocillopora damicornis]
MAEKGSGLELSSEAPWQRVKHPTANFSALCLFRIKRDITSMYKEPPPGLYAVADENDITKVHALVIGPRGTPYEGGFYYFLIAFTPDYPIKPPKVRLLTTGNGRVRFNPNLYKNGLVCLSILGTWPGPAWSPAQTLSSLLISIQSLMNEKPYHNEPGYEGKEAYKDDSKRYNECIQHENLRVAVCDMLEGKLNFPPALRKRMEKLFLGFYDRYSSVVKENMLSNGKRMKDPFGENEGKLDYASIKYRLDAIKSRLDEKKAMGHELDDSSSEEEEEQKQTREENAPEIDDWDAFLYDDD